jgi:WD40 repeat protein
MKLLTLVPAVVTISGVLIGVVWYLCEPRADDIDRDALGMYRTAQGIAKAGVQDPITPGSADALVARLQDRGNGGIANLVVASDGKRLATTCVDGTMKVWDIQERKLIREAWSGQDNVSGPVVISTDGKVLAWGTNDAQILLCDLDKPGQAKVLRGHMDRISALAFSPDGLLLASGSRDKSVRVWDLLRRGVVKAELRDQIDYPTVSGRRRLWAGQGVGASFKERAR